jgi:hypothetical protein
MAAANSFTVVPTITRESILQRRLQECQSSEIAKTYEEKIRSSIAMERMFIYNPHQLTVVEEFVLSRLDPNGFKMTNVGFSENIVYMEVDEKYVKAYIAQKNAKNSRPMCSDF